MMEMKCPSVSIRVKKNKIKKKLKEAQDLSSIHKSDGRQSSVQEPGDPHQTTVLMPLCLDLEPLVV